MVIQVSKASGKLHVNGNILSKGYNIGSLEIKTMGDVNYNATASSLINGYFKSNNLSDDRFFNIPTVTSIISAIPNCAVSTSLRFTVNNVQSGNHSRNIISGSVTIDSSCYNINLHP